MNCPKIRFISFIVRKVMKVNNERTSGFRQAHAFLINKIPYFHGFIHKILNFVPNGQYVYSASDLGTKISEPQLSAITSRFPGVRHNLKIPGCRILPQNSKYSAITSRFQGVRHCLKIPSCQTLPQGSQLSDITSLFQNPVPPCGETDGSTDLTKLIVALRNSANAH